MPLDNNSEPVTKILITPPKFERAVIRVVGTAPYVQNKFSAKARHKIEATQREGSRSRKGSQKEARDFEDDWKAAMHVSTEGWAGIPAPAFRNAMIDACRMAGFQMTRAKMSIFVEADGIDADSNEPLLKLEGKLDDPTILPVRNESGVIDLRCRPVWSIWSTNVRLRWDADQFSVNDVMNLLSRAGVQVGIGEGRPFSKNSNGMGWGTWEVQQ
jgi:hypothetical protein